jgi:hypothetical protein
MCVNRIKPRHRFEAGVEILNTPAFVVRKNTTSPTRGCGGVTLALIGALGERPVSGFKSILFAFALAAMLSTANAFAEHESPTTTVSVRGSDASTWNCNLDDELAREQVFNELEKVQASLFVRLHNPILTTGAGSADIEFQLEKSGESVKNLMLLHFAYQKSFRGTSKYLAKQFETAAYQDDAETHSQYTLPVLPALAPIGLGRFLIYRQRRSLQITGKFLLASGIMGAIVSSSGQSSSAYALGTSSKKLTAQGQSILQRNAYQPLEPMIGFLSDVLNWSVEEKERFRKRLHADIFNGITKAVVTNERRGKIDPIVVAKEFEDVNLIQILKDGKFATAEELAGFQKMQKLLTQAQTLSRDMSEDEAVAHLADKADADARSAIETIRAIVRLRGLIHSALPAQGQIGRDYIPLRDNLAAKIDRSLSIIRELCQLGALGNIKTSEKRDLIGGVN